MSVVRPFKAVRPDPKLAEQVASLPYDVMSSREARELAAGNPYSFLHISKAEIDLDPAVDRYHEKVYEKARENLMGMVAEGIFFQEEKPCLYIYKQVMEGRAQVGIVGCASVDDYRNHIIKQHELTRADKEQDRFRHVDYCDANTGPIFLTYRRQSTVDALVQHVMKSKSPVYDFVSEDGIGHTVWVIDRDAVIEEICQLFEGVENLYIADGHHRSASAVGVGLKRREQNPGWKGDEEFNFFLSVLFPHDQLRIMAYNRVVKDLNGYTQAEFLDAVKETFHVEEYRGIGGLQPAKKHTFGMYLTGKWYLLTAREGSFEDTDPVARLDVSILQDTLLAPILGIRDPCRDSRIGFVGGIRGLQCLADRVDSGEMQVAFSMYPTTMEDLMDIADAGAIMPPKSTWFEPKLRSGLFIHKLQ